MTESSNPSKNTFSPQAKKQIEDILLGAGCFKAEVENILRPYQKIPDSTTNYPQILEHLFLRFHVVAKQLQKRQRQKRPFDIKDEYDVQDLLHALLKINFKDIRPEEYCPSYAGTSSRIDFFLKNEYVAIEAKIASKNHNAKSISKELILDKEYYKKKNDVRTLYCLVYDPQEVIANPLGFETDLNEISTNFENKVFIIPRRY
jgi:hypothetical protein